jgi:hypothetical protein
MMTPEAHDRQGTSETKIFTGSTSPEGCTVCDDATSKSINRLVSSAPDLVPPWHDRGTRTQPSHPDRHKGPKNTWRAHYPSSSAQVLYSDNEISDSGGAFRTGRPIDRRTSSLLMPGVRRGELPCCKNRLRTSNRLLSVCKGLVLSMCPVGVQALLFNDRLRHCQLSEDSLTLTRDKGE